MKKSPTDDRSPIAIGLEWSTRIITLGLEMAIPTVGGYWLDKHWGTLPFFVCVGAFVGVAIAVWQFFLIARQLMNRND
jgi:hypothetical protein